PQANQVPRDLPRNPLPRKGLRLGSAPAVRRAKPHAVEVPILVIFAGQSREQLRRMYLDAWRKFSARQPLEPLEAQLAAVIAEHPEYLEWIEAGEQAIAAEFTPESGRQNPFLHMGLHLAIRE